VVSRCLGPRRRDRAQLLDSPDGEVVAIIPDTQWFVLWGHRVDFVLVVERLVAEPSPS
jgi:hypothetical protein